MSLAPQGLKRIHRSRNHRVLKQFVVLVFPTALGFCLAQPSREEREAAKGASEAGRGGKKSGSRGNKKGGKADVELGGGGDHINALGLPNDGYNYEQHFKSMGACLCWLPVWRSVYF